MTWSGYIVVSRQLRKGMSVVTLMAAALPIATSATLPYVLITGDIDEFDTRSMVYIVILTLLTGVGAHGLIVFSQRHVPIGIMSMMQVGQPALAVVWSAIFLSQSIRALQFVGMAMVVFGLITVVVQTQRRTAKEFGSTSVEL